MTDNNKKTHLIVTGRGGGDQVQADWSQTDSEQPDYIKNKPELATVATTGDYDDLTNKPTIPEAPVQSDWSQTDSTALDYIKNKPTIPAAQVNSDWNSNSGVSQILNKPSLATVATSGNYSDLNGTPTLATVATSGNYSDLNGTPTLATVATSGDYDDLQNKPTIPAAQVNSDWNANSGVAQILNKPTMTTETLTFTLQGGSTKIIEFYTVPNYFYVEDISGSDNTLSIIKNNANAPTVEVFKSTDKTNWTSMGTTDTTAITATIPASGRLYLKATTDNWDTNKIRANKNHNIGGNIMSLLYGDNFEGQTTFPTNSTSFNLAFLADTKMINAESLVLPATTLNAYCYQQMFGNCSALLTAPALPATTLAQNCYSYMFNGCTSLTETPALPATTLASQCYNSMFGGCSALTTAPETLPATTLKDNCYKQMFSGCSALTTAPVLPATTLVSNCYYEMFYNCRSLNKITTYATSVNSGSQLGWWCSNVAATGDFYNLGGATYPSGGTGIPNGWTVHTSL